MSGVSLVRKPEGRKGTRQAAKEILDKADQVVRVIVKVADIGLLFRPLYALYHPEPADQQCASWQQAANLFEHLWWQ